MPKNILFCADGTCNGPNEVDDEGYTDPTNVYRLFVLLNDDPPLPGVPQPMEQEITQNDATGVVQAAKYIDGVGDAGNPIMKLFGAAAGMGLVARLVRGFTYISRNYVPGDLIFLAGFSRGAYTARALAGLILHNGLLDRATYDPANQQLAYQLGAAAWYDYQKTIVANGGIFGDFAAFVANLPGFFTGPQPSYVPVGKDVIDTVAVWDTVSSYGFSAAYDADGAKTDLYPLASTKLSGLVAQGFQAVSLDEQRDAFVPILWDAADHVEQVLFPGAHADIGGGYSIHAGQAQLSQVTLDWMSGRLQTRGVKIYPNVLLSATPNPAGIAHQPWRYAPWSSLPKSIRSFAGRKDVSVDGAVQLREAAPGVVFDPGTNTPPPMPRLTARYRPANLP